MRRATMTVLAGVATLVTGVVPVGAAAPAGPGGLTMGSTPRTVGDGYTQRLMFELSSPTTIDALPDGRIVILEQGGTVRIRTAQGALLPDPALTIPSICVGSERGLLGFAAHPDLDANGNGFVYLYFTRDKSAAPGGCVNRVSRFRLTDNVIDWDTQKVLLDNISSVNGNHNGGDIAFGADGYLYVAVGDAGSDPRGDSGEAGGNDAAQDLSLLNGKILRIRPNGMPAPDNPYSGTKGARCAKRGNTPATPRTRCREIYAWGVRNPYRFNVNPAGTTFFINDVGQGTWEEVNRGRKGANYGWPVREGACPQGLTSGCGTKPARFTDPIAAYTHDDGSYITAGAFVPVGSWPDALEGGYLFADGGSGRMWFRSSSGAFDVASPFATDLDRIVDMDVTVRRGNLYLWFVRSSGEVERISYTG